MIKFKAKRIDRDEYVEGYYFKTPLTDANSEVSNKFGWFFLSDGITRHCISDINGIVFVIDETTLTYELPEDDSNVKELNALKKGITEVKTTAATYRKYAKMSDKDDSFKSTCTFKAYYLEDAVRTIEASNKE